MGEGEEVIRREGRRRSWLGHSTDLAGHSVTLAGPHPHPIPLEETSSPIECNENKNEIFQVCLPKFVECVCVGRMRGNREQGERHKCLVFQPQVCVCVLPKQFRSSTRRRRRRRREGRPGRRHHQHHQINNFACALVCTLER